MRRIDVIGIGIGMFAGGGVLYLILRSAGLNTFDAGIWTQALLVFGIIGWLFTYLYRVVNRSMTYNQQLQEYEDAVLQKRLDALSPEELAQLQAEVEAERSAKQKASTEETH